MLKPHFNFSELSKNEIHELVKSEFDKHAKTIEIKKYDGEVKLLGHQHYLFEDILAFVEQRENIMLVGPAGSGKTHTAHAVAKALELDFYAISVGMMTTKTDFFGYMDANGKYVSTQFRRAIENGGVFLLDEMDAGNANVLTTINMALANDFVAFPDGMVERHNDFVLIAGANTYGTGSNREYVGRNQLDAATLNRFNMIEFPYDESLEDAITQHISPRFTKYCQKLRANIQRLKIKHIISPRQSITGGRMINRGMDVKKVEQYVLFKNLSQSDINRIKDGVTF
jgi:MoxR-like ATPase